MILVTGGAGYIGSHTVLELLQSGREVAVVDNFSNSSRESLRRVQQLTGKSVKLFEADIRDRAALDAIFANNDIESVIHFAGLKAVGESVRLPIDYYDNNVNGTLVLLRAMAAHNVKRIIFSSSATVYGAPKSVPIREDFPLSTTNPYGATKLMIEQILGDLFVSDNEWSIVLLRYFNPVGAHRSGQIGEDPSGIPNNLMPYITQVAVGRLKELSVFGDDYPTHDGTGVRDYIHVVDLALGHLAALNKLDKAGKYIYNLGTGKGYSVLDIVKAFGQASGRTIAYRIAPRRAGDIAECYADPSLAAKELNWTAKLSLNQMCEDSWRWQSLNPNGYNK